jgi:hypothetical protein
LILKTFIYNSRTCIPSCRAGEDELQTGEEITIFLKPKNPLWPERLKLILNKVKNGQHHTRQYEFTYKEADLRGGPEFDQCDIEEIRCYSCCDAITERLDALIRVLPVTENANGTFTYNAIIP